MQPLLLICWFIQYLVFNIQPSIPGTWYLTLRIESNIQLSILLPISNSPYWFQYPTLHVDSNIQLSILIPISNIQPSMCIFWCIQYPVFKSPYLFAGVYDIQYIHLSMLTCWFIQYPILLCRIQYGGTLDSPIWDKPLFLVRLWFPLSFYVFWYQVFHFEHEKHTKHPMLEPLLLLPGITTTTVTWYQGIY